MRKVTIILLGVLLAMSIQVQAQQQHVFEKGSLMFNGGIGVPYNYGFIPSINFSGEYGVIPTGDVGLVSFGGLFEIQFAKYGAWNSYSGVTKPIIYLGPRAAWHLHVFESDKWDVYGGVGFGIRFRPQPYEDYYKSSVSGYGEGFVGGRMMFSEKFGLYAELGGGAGAFMRFGVTFGF